MKLDRLMSGVFAASAVLVGALACGCSSTPAPKTTASAPVSDAVAFTELMSAQLPAPSPRVGKRQIVSDDELEGGGAAAAQEDVDAIPGPKTGRRDDGSRRSGGFGTTK
jgi:hypothetical protein